MSDQATFGAWLRRLRQSRGLTQDALAEQAGCATQTIRKIEAGERRPSLQMADRLAAVLGMGRDERGAWMLAAREVAAPQQAQAAPAPPEHPGLPAYFTAFVGRGQERADLVALLGAPGHRLITLLGPGGIGKTRLAVEVARGLDSFPDGVFFVSLAQVAAAAAAVGEALGLVAGRGDLVAQLVGHLRDKRLLLILDSLEHLLDQGGATHELLGQILAQAPGVTILATSREQIRLSGEWVIELDGLPSADGPQGQGDPPAVSLFFEHARRLQPDARPGPDDRRRAGEICRLVGGMPLAIELAAAWVTALSYAEIAAEIRRGLDFLTLADRDLPPRHRSMRVVFEQSWQLLSEPERSLLAQVAIFRGGFSREAATFICRMKLPQLAGLVQKSLVRRSGQARYDTHEVIRRFAAEKQAESPRAATTRQRFGDYYLALSAEAAYMFANHGDRRGLEGLGPEIDNLREAMRQALAEGRGEQGARISTALRVYWMLNSLYREGIAWAEEFLGQPGLSDAARGDQLNTISYLARASGMLERARAAAEDAVAAHRRSGDVEGLAWALGSLAQITLTLGEYETARALHQESVRLRRAVSGPHTLAWGTIMLSIAELLLADRAAAQATYAESLALARSIDDRFTEGGAHNYYALGLTLLGDRAAAPIAARALELLSDPYYPWGAIIALEVLAAQAGLAGRHREAGRLYGAARQTRHEHQISGSAIYRDDYDRLQAMARGSLAAAEWAAALAEGAALARADLLALAGELGWQA